MKETQRPKRVGKDRRGQRFLTKYERAKVLGVRAEQLSKNAPTRAVIPEGEHRALEIAKLELRQKCMDLILCRHFPDGTVEEWAISEMIVTEK